MSEIERKFLLSTMPPKGILGTGVPVDQGYIFVEGGELRIRRKGDHYYLTVKGEGSVARDEWETEIPKWVFDTLWPKTEGRRIAKTRYHIPHGVVMLELDEYRQHLEGLIVMECELPSQEAANGMVLPAWATSAVDVTEDRAYKNKVLATRGLPKSGAHTH